MKDDPLRDAAVEKDVVEESSYSLKTEHVILDADVHIDALEESPNISIMGRLQTVSSSSMLLVKLLLPLSTGDNGLILFVVVVAFVRLG